MLLHEELLKNIKKDKVVIICIGTDRNIADSFAPFVGTLLERSGVKDVYGTLDEPIHALNIRKRMFEIYDIYKGEDVTYLSIDACLNPNEEVELYTINFRDKPIQPGRGLGKELGEVGSYSIVGYVGRNRKALHETRLSSLLPMVEETVDEIKKFYELREIRDNLLTNTYEIC